MRRMNIGRRASAARIGGGARVARRALILALVLWHTPVRADLPPSPDYVEDCTRARQEADEEFCETVPASFRDIWGCGGEPSVCSDSQGEGKFDVCCADRIAGGWTYRCKTYGASVYGALWCRARAPGDEPRPADEPPCTVEAQEGPGEECVACGFATEGEDCGEHPEPWDEPGFTSRCSDWFAADYGVEVWCRPAGAGCAAARHSPNDALAGALCVLLLAGALAVIGRRRSRGAAAKRAVAGWPVAGRGAPRPPARAGRRLLPFALLALLVACSAGGGAPGGASDADAGGSGPGEVTGGGVPGGDVPAPDGGPARVDGTGPDGGPGEQDGQAGRDVPAPPATNACGGAAALTYQGAPAQPGAACGGCDGVLACDGPDVVVCSRSENACGGCGSLAVAPGAGCGPCGDGVVACRDDGGTECRGASPRNVCGGCGALDAAPGGACGADGGAGAWVCTPDGDLACLAAAGGNACGGSGALASAPGTPCGACDEGVWRCDGGDSLACDGEGGVNACGSCGPLPAEPGAPCGRCGGTWVCADGALRCEDPTNACGGCAPLAAVPGAACEGGAWACAGDGGLRCAAGAVNACGGTAPLAAEPGAACGECGDGTVACAGPDAVTCRGAAPRNACASCLPLPAQPGDVCGPAGWEWTCDDAGALRCVEAGDREVVGLGLSEDGELELAVGDAVFLRAFAYFDDDTERDVSAETTWEVDSADVVEVRGDGRVLAVAEGRALVRARWAGWEAELAVTVTEAVVTDSPTALRVTPATSSAPVGRSVTFVAEADFASGATADVSGQVAWSSSDEACAIVSGGAVHALAEGAVTITARLDDLSASATLTVTAPELVSLALEPAALTLAPGASGTLRAVATYSDDGTEDVTAAAVWESSAPAVASVAAGLVEALGYGEATIQAAYEDRTATATVSVPLPGVSGLAIEPADTLTIGVGGCVRYGLVATMDDGTTREAGDLALWTSSDEEVASGAADGWFCVTGTGTTTITASIGAAAATVDLAGSRAPSAHARYRGPVHVYERQQLSTIHAKGVGFSAYVYEVGRQSYVNAAVDQGVTVHEAE